MLATIFGTYRYIMHHQQLEYGENNTVYSTVFGYTDTYYVEPLEDDATTRIMNELYDAFNNVNQDGEYTITKDGNTISITK
jgi:hypothetical protein